MSKLDDLIAELCPNGVEYKKLSDISTLTKGKQLNKKDLSVEGPYPVINGGVEPSGYYHEYNKKENTITISQGGASAGYVNYIDTKFWSNAHCYTVDSVHDYMNNRFVYHFLKNNERNLRDSQYGAGIPALSMKSIGGLEIPIPPLEVQEEIVRILDTFTELAADLTAELTAELTTRKQQYEYYRDELLSEDRLNELCPDGVEYIKLGEIASIKRGRRVIKKELSSSGEFPVYQNCLTPLGYYDKQNFDACTTYIICAGAAGEIGYSSVPFWAADDCTCIECPKRLNDKYVYYYLMSKQNKIKRRVRKASIPRLSNKTIENIKIPIPPLEVQEEIVRILDNFCTLTTDISEGLPAEIEARQKQYEYYRDKLLTF